MLSLVTEGFFFFAYDRSKHQSFGDLAVSQVLTPRNFVAAAATVTHTVDNIKNGDSGSNLLVRPLSPPMEQVSPTNQKTFFPCFANIVYLHRPVCVIFVLGFLGFF